MHILFDRYLFRLVLFFIFLGSASPILFAQSREIYFSAAVSTKEALQEITDHFTKESSVRVNLNFGASGSLVAQILAGAPCDALLSADEQVIKRLISAGRIQSEEVSDLLSNQLVIAQRNNTAYLTSKPSDLLNPAIKRIAIGKPGLVPAGNYAEQWLKKIHLFDSIQSKLIFTPHVRAATASLGLGNVDAAVVYLTDIAHDNKLQATYKIPLEDGPKITYPLAKLSASRDKTSLEEFFRYLRSDSATEIFKRHGFLIPKSK